MRCNLFLRSGDVIVPLFQSLLGFLMRCNRRENEDHAVASMVSIPIGFSNAL